MDREGLGGGKDKLNIRDIRKYDKPSGGSGLGMKDNSSNNSYSNTINASLNNNSSNNNLISHHKQNKSDLFAPSSFLNNAKKKSLNNLQFDHS